ncbi:zinc finger, CCHC-type containing protein [Tanacetum coccineum]
MKNMVANFSKLDKFEGVYFRIWQKNMHFLLYTMSVVYVLTTPMPKDGENATVEQIQKRSKWENDDYVCRGIILNESLKAKYMAKDASSKKFLVSDFTNYKMTDSRPIMEQYNELLGTLVRFTQHNINMDEVIQVSCIIDKLPSSWKEFKHTLKHKKEELTLVELGRHLHIEESLRVQNSDKPKGNHVVGPSVINMVEHNNYIRYNDNKGKRKHQDTKADPSKKSKLTCWKCRIRVHLKRDCKGGKFWQQSQWAIVRLPDPKLKTLSERGIECIFVGYVEHSNDFRFYVFEPNESVLITSIIDTKDAIFDDNRLSSVPRLRTRDEVSGQHSYCLNVEDVPKTFDEAMKSQDVAFWKEAISDEMDSIMGNNTWVLTDLPPGCKPLGCKWIFKRKLKVDGTIEKFKARLFSITLVEAAVM